jgi:hypothetical protein
MAYTNIELVRKHLQESIRSGGRIENHCVRLEGLETIVLPHAGLIADSERVKGKAQAAPASESVVLLDEPLLLARSDIIPESTAAAKDSSLTEIYTENVDYILDYLVGTIRRIPGGGIESGQSVVIWYYNFTLFSKDQDYLISYQNGELTRVDSGRIADGQTVWIDYEIESGLFADDVITNAINEASAQIESRIESVASDDSAFVLTIAETYLTISILTQIRALEVIQSSALSATGRSGLSAQLLEISNRYRQEYEDMIKPFQKAGSRLAGPTRQSP